MVTEIKSIEQFDEIVKDGIVLVKFGAKWCGPCKMLKPILDDIANTADSFKVCDVDSDDLPELMERFGIRSVPTIFFFKDGKKSETLIGSQTKESIIKIIDSLK